MNKEDSLTSEQAFVLGVQNHKKNNFREAENFYKKTIKKNIYHCLLEAGKVGLKYTRQYFLNL